MTFGLIVLSLLFSLIRLIRGPDLLSRIVAFDLFSIGVIALIILYAHEKGFATPFIPLILIFSLIGFSTTVFFMDILSRDERE